MRASLAFGPLLFAACLAAACAGSSRAPLPPQGARAPIGAVAAPASELRVDLTRLEHLLTLPGRSTTLRYSPGALDRAARLQERAEGLAEVFHKIGSRPAELRVWVLDREDWEAAGLEREYGLPERVGGGAFAVPAVGDPGQVALLSGLLGGQPPIGDAVPLRGSAEEAAALGVADDLFQVEAARDFGERVRLVGDRPWVTGVLAHLAARVAFERFEPGRMAAVAATFDRIAESQGGFASRRLEDYSPGLPVEIDLWYQAQLLRGADALWVREGERGSIRYLYRTIQASKPVSAAELERAYPALASWRSNSFAP